MLFLSSREPIEIEMDAFTKELAKNAISIAEAAIFMLKPLPDKFVIERAIASTSASPPNKLVR